MISLFWVGLGSALGGSLRYSLDQLAQQLGAWSFPISTFGINISGSLLIGFLAGIWASGGATGAHPCKWHFWMTGFCGGYTTFSAFSWQLLVMIQEGHAQLAGFYAAASVGLGLIAVWAGLSWSSKRTRKRKHEKRDQNTIL